MNYEFSGAFSLPGIQGTLETYENTFYWGRFEDQLWTGIMLSGASRDTGNTAATTVLRPGLILGKITATGKIKEWNPTGTDGSERIFGVLGPSQNVQRLGADADRWLGYIWLAGNLKAGNVIVPGNAAMGIVGDATEYLIRAQLQSRAIWDDIPQRVNPFGGWMNIVAKTADYTITEAMNNTIFTNRGASGTIIPTLPATAKKGLRYGFFNVAAQIQTVTSGTADTMIVKGDATADTLSTPAAIGSFIEVMGDGTGWMVITSGGYAGTAVPAALTVTDGVGTNDGTIGAITADASVIAAVQELAAKINAIIAALPGFTLTT